MTIDEVMRLAREASHKRATEANWHGLRAAVLALLDAEAEACAGVCENHLPILGPRTALTMEPNQHDLAQAIRARIAARKGGA
jgi:hypothetical protein